MKKILLILAFFGLAIAEAQNPVTQPQYFITWIKVKDSMRVLGPIFMGTNDSASTRAYARSLIASYNPVHWDTAYAQAITGTSFSAGVLILNKRNGSAFAQNLDGRWLLYTDTTTLLAHYVLTDGTRATGTWNIGITGNAATATILQTTRTIQGISFNGSANINIINGTGFVKASGTTLSYDNSTYLTGNQTITLSGDVSGSGATAITTTIGAGRVTNAMLVNSQITLGSTVMSLGSTYTTIAGLSSLTSTTFIGALTGNATTATAWTTGRTISGTGEATFTTGAMDGSGNVTGAVTLTNSAVIGKVLTGYVSGAGTVSATDNILQAIQKLNGNIAAAGFFSRSGTTISPTNAGDTISAGSGVFNNYTSSSGYNKFSKSIFTNYALPFPVANNGTGSVSPIEIDGDGLVLANNVGINANDELYLIWELKRANGDVRKSAVMAAHHGPGGSGPNDYDYLEIHESSFSGGVNADQFGWASYAAQGMTIFPTSPGTSGDIPGANVLRVYGSINTTSSYTITSGGGFVHGGTTFKGSGSITYTFPASATNGYVLSTDGSGNLSWIANGVGLTNPMTTTGDMIIGGASGTPTRLAGGTNTYVLTMVSGSPAWAAGGGGGTNYWQDVAGVLSPLTSTDVLAVNATSGNYLSAPSGGTGNLYQKIITTGNTSYYGVESSAGGSIFTNGAAYSTVLGTTSARALQLFTNNVMRMGINSSGQILFGNSTNYDQFFNVSNGTTSCLVNVTSHPGGGGTSITFGLASGVGHFYTETASDLELGVGGTPHMKMFYNSNVGRTVFTDGTGTTTASILSQAFLTVNSSGGGGIQLSANNNGGGVIYGSTSGGLKLATYTGVMGTEASLTTALTINSSQAATFAGTLGINGTGDNVKSGTYTPTLVATGNTSTVTAYQCQYIRVGNVVTVSGIFAMNNGSGSGANGLTMTLPIASSMTSSENLGGTAVYLLGGGAFTGSNIVVGSFSMNGSSLANFNCATVLALSATTFSFSFTYLVQ